MAIKMTYFQRSKDYEDSFIEEFCDECGQEIIAEGFTMDGITVCQDCYHGEDTDEDYETDQDKLNENPL